MGWKLPVPATHGQAEVTCDLNPIARVSPHAQMDSTRMSHLVIRVQPQCRFINHIYVPAYNVEPYCAGTVPWGNPGEHHDFEPQRHDDGCIEVIGFTMASLVCLRFLGSLGLRCPRSAFPSLFVPTGQL
eukprot:g29223.t1